VGKGGRQSWKSRLRDPVTLALGATALAAVAFAIVTRPAPPAARRVVRFVIAASDSLRPVSNYPWPAAISPDGGTVIYTAGTGTGAMFYALRTDQLDAHPIPGTNASWEPSFSPDGQWLLFQGSGKIRKVRLDGSAPISIADGGTANGSDWTSRDEIILGSEGQLRGLSKVSAAGGDLALFAKPDASNGETNFLWPIATPDGKTAVFMIWTGSLAAARLATASIDDGEVNRLGIKGVRPLAVIGRTLIYVQVDGAVMAVKLDRSGRGLDGIPVPVLDPVSVIAGNNGNSGIFISQGGALITASGGTKSQLSWVSRDGSFKPIMKESRSYDTPRLSPDGRRIAITVGDRDKSDIWIYDLETGTFSRLSSAGATGDAVWSPDGTKVFYAGLGDKQRFAVWSQQADGGSPPEKILDASLISSLAMAPDGKSIVYTSYYNNSLDIFRARLDSTSVQIPYLNSTSHNEVGPSFSPDGRWTAVTSDESGKDEVYIRSYPIPSARIQISAGGGSEPIWSRDGTRINYRSGSATLSAALAVTPTIRVISRDTLVAGSGSMLANGVSRNYDIAGDGRVLGLISSKDDYQLIAVPDWRTELEQRLAAAAKRH
jgi:eukaryotic-like serine/threonine-protein kinase